MITTTNYFEESKNVDFSQLPASLQKGHDYISKATANGLNWNIYQNSDGIKRVIDTYIEKLNEVLAKPKPEPKKSVKPAFKEAETTNETEKEYRITQHDGKPGSDHQKTKQTKPAPVPTDDLDTIDFVERIPDEIRFIKRYISLDGKLKDKHDILLFLNALHRSIATRVIRASSPYADHIEYIQKKLVNKYNSMSRAEVIEVSSKTLSEFKALVASQRVMPSVNLIKRYISLNGRIGVKERASTLVKAMEKAHSKGLVPKKDKYYKVFDKMYKSLISFVNSKTQKILSIQETELSGLNGILKENGEYNDTPEITSSPELAGIQEYVATPGNAMSIDDAKNAQFKTIGLTGEYRDLIGDACMPTHIFFYGNGGGGKTTHMLKFSEYLNQRGYKILYVAGEQYNTPAFSDLLRRLNISGNDEFVIAKDLSVYDLTNFDYVALDSKDSLAIEVEDFREMKKAFPNQSFLISSQGTKTGNFTGKGQWRNEVDTMVHCENGIATTDNDKNRWGGKGEVRIYDDNYRQAA